MAGRGRGRPAGPARGRPEAGVGRGRGRSRRVRADQTVDGPVIGAGIATAGDVQMPLGQLGEMTSETLAAIAQMVQAELRGRGAETARLEEATRSEREDQATLEADRKSVV